MKNHKFKIIIFSGICSIILLLLSIMYSIYFNESRLVVPTDFSTFEITLKDIPMIVSCLLVIVYVIFLFFELFRFVWKNKNQDNTHTRQLSANWGYFGFLGFVGFAGFYTYSTMKVIFPFIFFIFFGFFSFFYEGKLSNTLKDELYKENEKKAELNAYKTGFSLLFIMIWLIGMGLFKQNTELSAVFMILSVSCIYALVLFLSKYLLYKYETKV